MRVTISQYLSDAHIIKVDAESIDDAIRRDIACEYDDAWEEPEVLPWDIIKTVYEDDNGNRKDFPVYTLKIDEVRKVLTERLGTEDTIAGMADKGFTFSVKYDDFLHAYAVRFEKPGHGSSTMYCSDASGMPEAVQQAAYAEVVNKES